MGEIQEPWERYLDYERWEAARYEHDGEPEREDPDDWKDAEWS